MAEAWHRSSREDLKVAQSLFEKKHYVYSLYFCHLAVEKELKRIYLIHREEIPPLFTTWFVLLTKPSWILTKK